MTSSRIATNPRNVALASPYMQHKFVHWEYPTLLQLSKICVVISPTYHNQQNLIAAVDALLGPTHECVRSRCARRSSLQHLPRRSVERSPGRDPGQGMRTAVCPRLGRPARAPPHAIDMRDEQHIRLEKIKAKRVKKIKVFDIFDWMISIGRDPLYL